MNEKVENDQTAIIVALFAVFLCLVIILIFRLRKPSRRGVILTGLCDSGKTAIFAQLIHKKNVQTQTSIIENVGTYIKNGKKLTIIDTPGHERLRYKYFDQYKNTARGIIYVIDSLSIQKDLCDVAEFLYNIITDQDILGNVANILIACNKQDVLLCKSPNAVKSMLEKELNTLKSTKLRQLESVDPKQRNITSLGDEGKDFAFSRLPMKVEFVESSALNRDENKKFNVTEIEEWLLKIC